MGDCEVCGEEIELTLDHLGEIVRCPQCGAEYEVDHDYVGEDSIAIWLAKQVSQPTRKPWSEA